MTQDTGIQLGVVAKDDTNDAQDGVAKLERVLSRLADQLDETKGKAKAEEAQTTRQTKARRAYNLAVKASTGALALLGVGVTGAIAGGGVLTGVVFKGVEAYRDQAKALGALRDSIRRNGEAGADLTEVYKGQLAAINELATSTDFGDDQYQRAAATYQNLTGTVLDQAQAQRFLGLAAGIAVKGNKDLTDATKDLAKARNGDVGVVKELVGLTKQQEAALNSIADPMKQQAAITKLLEDNFQGAADTGGTFYGSLKNATDAGGDFLEKIGEVATEAPFFVTIFDLATETLGLLAEMIGNNSGAITQWIGGALEPGINALENFDQVAAQLAPVITAGVVAVQSAGPAFRTLWGTIKTVYSAIQALVALILEGMLGAFESLADAGARAARFIGDEGMARQLEGLGNKARQYKAAAADLLNQSLKDTASNAYETAGAAGELADTVGRAGEVNARVKAGLDKLTPTMKRYGAQLRKNVKDAKALNDETKKTNELTGTGQGAANSRQNTAGPDRKKAEEARKRAAEEKKRLEDERKRRALAVAQLGILRETDARRRALLELRRAELEIAQSDLLASERKLALLEAEQTYRQTLRDLDLAAADQRAQALADATQALDDFEFGGPIGSLVALGAGIDDVISKYETMAAAGRSDSEAFAASLDTGFGVLSSALQKAGLETADYAAIQGALQAAQGTAQLIFGNAPGAAALFANSAAFFTVAATAGKGGGGGRGAGASGSASRNSSAGASGPSTEQQIRTSARIFAEEQERRGRSSSGDTTYIIGQGATFLESAESTKRRIRDLQESSRRTRV